MVYELNMIEKGDLLGFHTFNEICLYMITSSLLLLIETSTLYFHFHGICPGSYRLLGKGYLF